MSNSRNAKVQDWLHQLETTDPDKFEIVKQIREIVFTTYPAASEKIMYGGIVFFRKKEMFSGLFTYTKHVSLEFSNGYLMKDPEKRLEGKGKYRRHLKINSLEEIIEKEIPFFIQQATS